SDINAVMDRIGLDEEAVSDSTPVSINVEGIRLRSALNLLLDQLKLGYEIKNEVLMITSQLRLHAYPSSLRILGLAPGRTKLTLADESDQTREIEVVVTGLATPIAGPAPFLRVVHDDLSNTVFAFGSEVRVNEALATLKRIDVPPDRASPLAFPSKAQ